MNENTAQDYKKLLSDALQKQMIILGPEIALAKAHNVPGLSVTDDGMVTSIDGNPQEVSIKLLEQFRELSPLMVKKTMKPLLNAIISAYPTSTAADAKQEEKPDEEPKEEKLEDKQEASHEEVKEPEEKHEEPKEENQPSLELKPLSDLHKQDEQPKEEQHEEKPEEQEEKQESAPNQPAAV